MENAITIAAELPPPSPIRIETALSRYPVHRLAKHGDIAIDIREVNEHGEVTIKWEVNHIPKYGQPGPLAYKLDTLIINRRIEEAARPIPRIIKLGSLKEIAGQLDLGGDTNIIKRALRQNATAFIAAKIHYKRSDGSVKSLEADFNRYNIVFTGEELPNGRKADAVYIVLSDIYVQVINGAMTRPLDYDYLKSLPPAPQRFYELLSYQMYAAIRNDRPRAKLVYSEFCTYAPQTRHHDWERVRSQMNKIYRPHIDAGYVAKIDYEQTVDGGGNPDWLMFYQPGPKARAEYRAFAKRGGPVKLEAEPLPPAPSASATAAEQAPAALQQPALPLAEPEPSPLEAALIGHGITPAKAAELVRQHDAEHIQTMIEYLDYELARKPGKIANPTAWLYSAIRDGCSKPQGFISRAERERQAEAARQRQQAEAEARRRAREEQARQQEEERAADAYWAALSPERQRQLEADALADGGEQARQTYETMKRFHHGTGGEGYLKLLRRSYLVKRMREGQLTPVEA